MQALLSDPVASLMFLVVMFFVTLVLHVIKGWTLKVEYPCTVAGGITVVSLVLNCLRVSVH